MELVGSGEGDTAGTDSSRNHPPGAVRRLLAGVLVGVATASVVLLVLGSVTPWLDGPSSLLRHLHPWVLLALIGVAMLAAASWGRAANTAGVRDPLLVGGAVLSALAGVPFWSVVFRTPTLHGAELMTAVGVTTFPAVLLVLCILLGRPRPRAAERLGDRWPVLGAGIISGIVAVATLLTAGWMLTFPSASTAQAPASPPSMPGPLAAENVTGELVATFSHPDLSDVGTLLTGARGPILGDSNTLIGVDGASGELLWQHHLRTGSIDSVMTSPDGTAVVVRIGTEAHLQQGSPGNGVVEVLDALTGATRFRLSAEVEETVSVTDHVVVVGTRAHGLVEGKPRWTAAKGQQFAPGTNAPSHLLVIPDPPQSADEDSEGLSSCADCLTRPSTVVSDQDPGVSVAEFPHLVQDDDRVLHQGWVLSHVPEQQTNTWVDIETLTKVPIQWGDPQVLSSGSGVVLHRVRDPASTVNLGVLDTLTRRTSDTVPRNQHGDVLTPLGEGVWLDGFRRSTGRLYQPELLLTTAEGTVIGRIPVAPPEGDADPAEYSYQRSVRTSSGVASLVSGRSRDGSHLALLLIHR